MPNEPSWGQKGSGINGAKPSGYSVSVNGGNNGCEKHWSDNLLVKINRGCGLQLVHYWDVACLAVMWGRFTRSH